MRVDQTGANKMQYNDRCWSVPLQTLKYHLTQDHVWPQQTASCLLVWVTMTWAMKRRQRTIQSPPRGLTVPQWSLRFTEDREPLQESLSLFSTSLMLRLIWNTPQTVGLFQVLYSNVTVVISVIHRDVYSAEEKLEPHMLQPATAFLRDGPIVLKVPSEIWALTQFFPIASSSWAHSHGKQGKVLPQSAEINKAHSTGARGCKATLSAAHHPLLSGGKPPVCYSYSN